MLKHVEFLEKVNTNKEVKTKIENFIKEKDFKLSDFSDENGELFKQRRKTAEEAKNLMLELSKKVDYSAIFFYFSLDKRLYPKMWVTETDERDNFLYATVNEGRRERVSGAHMQEAYSRNYIEYIAFLEENLNLLPNSTKLYVKKQMERKTERIKFKKISDLFAAKAFESSLAAEPDLPFLEKVVSTFRNILEIDERIKSFVYLLKTLNTKYKYKKDQKKLKKIKKKILTSIENDISIVFKKNIENTEALILTDLITELIKGNYEIIDFLIERGLLFKKSMKTLFYFYKINEKDANEALLDILAIEKYKEGKSEIEDPKIILNGKQLSFEELKGGFEQKFKNHHPDNIKKQLKKRGISTPPPFWD